jgi:hypothetical protein
MSESGEFGTARTIRRSTQFKPLAMTWDRVAALRGCFNRSMAASPLCPVVLSMLGARPRPIHEVARELRSRTLRQGEDYLAARTTLERLQAAGLDHATGDRTAGHVFRLTARGRRELRFQRLLWARLESTAITAF